MAKNQKIAITGGWAESVRFDTIVNERNETAQKMRSFEWILKIRLRSGDIFGIDNRGPFAVKLADEFGRIIAAQDGLRGINATIMLYRLDGNRGWVQSWECSRTTRELVMWYKTIRKRSVQYEDRLAPRNPLAETKGTHYFLVLS